MAVEDVMVKDENGNFVSAFTATSYVNDINELKNDINTAGQYKTVGIGRKVTLAANSGVKINIIVDSAELNAGYRPAGIIGAKNESAASQLCITGFDWGATSCNFLVRNIGSSSITTGFRLNILMAPESSYSFTSYSTYE